MNRIKRIYPGFYKVGDRWYVEKDEGTGKWLVMVFKEDSEELERQYEYNSYGEARDYALLEANVTELCNE